MKAPLSYLPALPAATGIVAGILLYRYTSLHICVSVAAVCLCAFIILYVTKRHYISFYFLSAVAGVCCALAHAQYSGSSGFTVPGKHLVEAQVLDISSDYDKPSVTVKLLTVDSMTVPQLKCRISSLYNPEIERNSTIRLRCHIADFPYQSDIPYEYDTPPVMFDDAITLLAYPLGDDIQVTPPAAPSSIINGIRDRIYRAIVNSPVSGDTASFLLAVILGERHFLDHHTAETYKALGIAHILALSGLHVGLIASLFALLLWPVRLFPRSRQIRATIILCAVWIYVLVCGTGDAVLRAAIMLSAVTASSLLQRSNYPANALLLAIALILACNPPSLFSPGFQLSVAAVMSILIFSPVIPKTLRRHPVLFFLANMAVLPVAAMIGTGLISAYHFSTFPSAFLPANIIVGLVFPYILTGGILLSALTAIGIEFSLLGHILDHVLYSMNKSIGILAQLSTADIEITHFSAWAFLPYFTAVSLLSIAIFRRKIWAAVSGVAAIIMTVTVIRYTAPILPASELYIVRYPSTCIVVRSGNKAGLLTTCQDHDTLAIRQIMESKCSRFLSSRRCAGLHGLDDTPSAITGFVMDGAYLYAGTHLIYVLNNDSIKVSGRAHPHYLLVGKKFTGNLGRAIELLSPDSIIVAADIHPSRRRRFLREIPDMSKVIDLKVRPFAIVNAK